MGTMKLYKPLIQRRSWRALKKTTLPFQPRATTRLLAPPPPAALSPYLTQELRKRKIISLLSVLKINRVQLISTSAKPSIIAEAPTMPQPIQQLGHQYHRAVAGLESPVTLLVRHLPEAIPHNTLTTLFSHYGASSVRPCSHGSYMKNCAFVDFKNEILASQAQNQLHGLRFRGKVLSVERSSTLSEDTKRKESGIQTRSMMKNASVPNHSFTGDSIHSSEAIAEKLGVDYPFPPHLEYAYPPPDGHILTNIDNALIAVPHFYTQVLHLMNKMNIPAPFRMALPTPPLPVPVHVQMTNVNNLSSSESEMESSDEESAGRNRKRVKRRAIVGPAVDKNVAHEAVGLKPVALLPREKPIIIKKNPLLQIRIAPKQQRRNLKNQT